MGYRSEVCLVVAVRTHEQADELMAIYAMDHRVQKHALADKWERHEGKDAVFLVYYDDHLKWYKEYEEVQGMEHLLNLARTFSDERTDVGFIPEGGDKPEMIVGFPYAAAKLRIGEETPDIEEEMHSSDSNLESDIWDRAYVSRRITLDF
jgi:hypothetical protein